MAPTLPRAPPGSHVAACPTGQVTAVGNERVDIKGVMPSTCTSHQDKLGTFRRLRGQETNGYAVYQRRSDDVMLWQVTAV